MTCGIYLGYPKSLLIDKVYIGQSKTIEDRISRHNSALRKGTHTPKMQKAFEEFGEFEWEIIKECPETLLDSYERLYISLFNAYKEGFNTYEDSSSAPILRGLDNGNANIDNYPICRDILFNTLIYPLKTMSEIASLSGTNIDTVKKLWNAQAYTWLVDIHPEEYAKVMELSGTRRKGGRTGEERGREYPTILSPTFQEYAVTSIKEFAEEHRLDRADLTNVLNFKSATVHSWIVKDLHILNPALHDRFNSSNRGKYRKQFTAYMSK
jgi:hypothetical protein